MTAIRTTCAYCGVGCGISAAPTGARSVTIAGDIAHPANRGRLCSKGTHLGETVGLEGRLLHPMIGDQRATWDEALDLVARRFSDAIAEHGPDSVAFYVSGQLLTEDYYVANKLMKGFIGSANIDTNSRLCMSSAVAAHNRAFGEDVVPVGYDDLDEADLIILVGSNTAWCHPIVWQRIEAARAARGTRLVVIDPRRTETAEGADLHLPIRPDGDVALFTGLLQALREKGVLDPAFLARHVVWPDGFWGALAEHDLWSTARACDVRAGDIQAFFDLVAEHPRTVTLFSQGANQSVVGTDKGNAIINLHLATGRIGKPGAGPFSITGQPNAMGGREVGGLANMLAAHMGFSDAERDRVQRFWNSPVIAPRPGLKAVDLFKAVGEGRIKALWIMATNPAVSLPDAASVRAALAQCPFVVVSDVIADTDTGRFAHVRLPAAAWGEKDGTVTNSERMISRQRAIFACPGEARPDWWIIDRVAERMGFAAHFAYPNAAAIFREHAALTAFENDGARKLNLSRWAALSDADYAALEPARWGGPSPFADSRFSHPDGKARIVALQGAPAPDVAGAPRPYTLNTGRYRDQWHSMTRTGLSAKLARHRAEPMLEIHPADAAAHAIVDGDLVRVTTAQGSSVFRAALEAGQRRLELFVPIHWTDRVSSGGRAGLLPAGAVDPVSGQPGFKKSPAAIEKLEPRWFGFIVSREQLAPEGVLYWTRARATGGWLTEIAGDGDPRGFAEKLLPGGQCIEAIDHVRGDVRRAVLDAGGQVVAALYLSASNRLPPRDWIIGQLDAAEPAPVPALLAARPAKAAPDRGPVVCACFDVGMKTIVSAIASQALTSVEAVGAALSAGTNCGSCRPAIRRLIGETRELAHG